MKRIVFLLEERSMKVLLEGLLPRLFPGLEFLCVPHEGKQDLERSLPRKLRGWREPGVKFVVVRDCDEADCRDLKARLVALCTEAGRADALIRIACKELEAWYLGDPEALGAAFGSEKLGAIRSKPRWRDPDSVAQPSAALAALVPEFQKLSGARRLAPLLSPERNRSVSFRIFVAGIERIRREFEGGGN